MFFLISKILAPFTVPLTYIFGCMVIAVVFYQRKPRLGKTCLLVALLLLLAFGSNFLPNAMLRRLESQYDQITPIPQVDAVVVLSGIVVLELTTPAYIEFGEGVERILAGIRFIKEGYGKVLIITGGSGDLFDQTKREAVFLRQFAIDAGVPAEKILIDAESRNTYENAVNTKALLQQQHLTSSILITNAAHLPRAMGCFKKLGLNPIPYPVDFHTARQPKYRLFDLIPGAEGLNNTEFALHEYFGLLTYKFAGYI